MSIIEAKNIIKNYSDNGIEVRALRDVSLSIEEGEFTVIAGPSGSGKTTLLNVLGSLDLPTEGEVFVEGKSLKGKTKTELSELRLKKIGFIFQAYNLIPVLTAMENIEFAMMLRGISEKERHARAIEVMKQLEIDELADKKPNQMSGGQQQRVAVARAIVNDPVIVLADEPTANLDSKTGQKLLDLMRKMNQEQGITFVFSSHDEQVIESGKRLVMLHDGKVDSDEIKSN